MSSRYSSARVLAGVCMLLLAMVDANVVVIEVAAANSEKGQQLEAVSRVLPVLEALANGAGHREFVSAPGDLYDLVDKPLSLAPWDIELVAKYFSRMDVRLIKLLEDQKDDQLARVNLLAQTIRDVQLPGQTPEGLADKAKKVEVVEYIDQLKSHYKSLRVAKLGPSDNMEKLKATATYKLANGLGCPASSAAGKQVNIMSVLGALKESTANSMDKLDVGKSDVEILVDIEKRAIYAGNAPVQILNRVLLKEFGSSLGADGMSMTFEAERKKFQSYANELGHQFKC